MKKLIIFKVRQVSETHGELLKNVWADIYDNEMNVVQIRRLAAKDNLTDKGSMKISWLARIKSCRQLLYDMAGKNFETDETPPSTTEWKKACHQMYVAADKVSSPRYRCLNLNEGIALLSLNECSLMSDGRLMLIRFFD